MLIIWISIAVIMGALVFLGISAARIFKEAKPAINDLKATSERIKQQTEALKEESNRLSSTQQLLKNDFENKKEAINTPIDEVKKIVHSTKNLWTSLPLIKIKK